MSFQSFLTLTAELLVVGSIALYGSLFLDGLMKRHRTIPGQLEIDFAAVQQPEPQPAPVAKPIAAVPAPLPPLEHKILPFKRRSQPPQPIDLSGKTIRELKAIASRVRLPKYNTCTKAGLQFRLVEEVEPDRLMQALEAIAA